MNRLTDRKGNPITREQINKILMEMLDKYGATTDTHFNIVNRLAKEFKVSKDSPAIGDISAIYTAQEAALNVMRNVLFELFDIPDTSAAGRQDEHTEQDKCTEQMM